MFLGKVPLINYAIKCHGSRSLAATKLSCNNKQPAVFSVYFKEIVIVSNERKL